MISKNDKRIFISGIYFIIATLGYTLYKILLPFYIRGFYAIDGYPIAWDDILFTLVSNVIFILYCFKIHRTDAEKKIYLFGLGIFALVRIYFIFSAGSLNAYVISDILLLTIMIFMIIARIKTNKVILKTVTLLFIAYALIKFTAAISEPMVFLNSINLIFLVYYIAEFIAFFNLWQVERHNLTLTQKSNRVEKTPLENDLISLKQLVDNGTISKEEYDQRKTEILNKL